jgi:hypothetical protein
LTYYQTFPSLNKEMSLLNAFCNLFQLGITQFRKLSGFIMVTVFGFIPCLLFLASLDFCNSINYITSLNYTNINDITNMKSKSKLIETQWDWFSNRHHTVLYIYACCVLDTIYDFILLMFLLFVHIVPLFYF